MTETPLHERHLAHAAMIGLVGSAVSGAWYHSKGKALAGALSHNSKCCQSALSAVPEAAVPPPGPAPPIPAPGRRRVGGPEGPSPASEGPRPAAATLASPRSRPMARRPTSAASRSISAAAATAAGAALCLWAHQPRETIIVCRAQSLITMSILCNSVWMHLCTCRARMHCACAFDPVQTVLAAGAPRRQWAGPRLAFLARCE